MIPKRVTLENFLSYGTPATVIDFAADEPLWVLGGPNGVGKSAVFDAITYCLFARHRGGGSGHDHLVRHGANGFAVAFEFEFAGTDYRVCRNRSGRRVTQSVERKAAGEWARVPDVDSAAQLDEWTERTLGLSYEAFTASVLLAQGKADELLEAKPAQRLDLLKKIIGVERYEALSSRVSAAAKSRQGALEAYARRRAGLPEVSDEEMDAADAAAAHAAAARAAADLARRAAADAVPLARQWATLSARREELERRVREADARGADAAAIRAGHARLEELSEVLPVLEKLIPLRAATDAGAGPASAAAARHAALAGELAAARQRAEALRVDAVVNRQAASDLAAEQAAVAAEQTQQQRLLAVADEVAGLRAEAGAFDPDLDGALAAARGERDRAAEADRVAGGAASEAAALLRQATRERDDFAGVESGVTCSRCGQAVTADHAGAERDRLARRAADLAAAVGEARAAAATAEAARVAADARLAGLTATIADRGRVLGRLADREGDLAKFGGGTDAAATRAALDRLGGRLAELRRRHAEARDRQAEAEAESKRLEPALRDFEMTTPAAEAEAARLATELARDAARRDALSEQVPEPWRAAADAAPFAAERDRLTAAGVAERFKELEQDAVRRDEWARQLDANAEEAAAVPGPSRVPAADAEARSRAAEAAFDACDAAHRDAAAHRDELARRRGELARLAAEVAAAEAEARVHAKLDKLLGKDRLQRELIREAEAEIVRLADHTAGQLSGGELSIGLAEPDGDDKAFELLVRRGDDPQPIGVRYLSGSQKFRVAVAVALAIGRFASGQARPLECVIIDEGFGSLDQEGLRAAAGELNRLTGFLKRIILVSHQEEFTDQFPVVIKLSRGDHGTTAECVRQHR